MTEPLYWLSPVGETDDFGNPVENIIIDGATTLGPWALMTPTAHARFGKGLGCGKGQKYTRQLDGRWLCTEGRC